MILHKLWRNANSPQVCCHALLTTAEVNSTKRYPAFFYLHVNWTENFCSMLPENAAFTLFFS